MIRVLVVDDSSFMRLALRRIIEAEGDLKVVGEAADGLAALELAARLRPEVVALDLEMPGLDGLGVTERLMALPDPPAIIMVSHHTREGSAAALAALDHGAVDYLWKGSALSGLDLGQIDRELRVRLRHWAAQRPRRPAPPPAAVPPAAATDATMHAPAPRPPAPGLAAPRPMPAFASRAAGAPPGSSAVGPSGRPVPAALPPLSAPAGDFDLLLIGASTGGPDALAALLGATGPLPVPCLLAQHMPADLGPDFARHLASRIGRPVLLAEHRMRAEPGALLLLPGGTDGHLARAADGALLLRLGAGPGPVHPSVDLLFQSAALVARRPLGVVLTGMGRDGAAGAAALVQRGGRVLVQSAASCVVSGMPVAAAEAVAAAGGRAEAEAPEALGRRIAALLRGRAAAG